MTMVDDDDYSIIKIIFQAWYWTWHWWWKEHRGGGFFSSHFPLFHIDINNPYIITIIVFKIKTRWMTTWLAQSTLAALTGWGQSTAKGSSSRSGTKKLRWLSLCPRRWWTSKTSDLLKSKTSSCKTLFPVKLFLRLSKMSMMRSGVITDQGWDHHYHKDGMWLAVW